MQENKMSKEKALEMFAQERAGLEEKADQESRDLHNSLKEALAKLSAKETECQNLLSELQSEKQSLPRVEARFRENEDRLKLELEEQRRGIIMGHVYSSQGHLCTKISKTPKHFLGECIFQQFC